MTLRVTDHALVRFLERAGGLDVEAVRRELAASLDRAEATAVTLGLRDYEIRADGLVYRVVNATVVTIVHAPRRG